MQSSLSPFPDREFAGTLVRHINERGSIDIPAVGASMYPWIRHGDICTFRQLQGPHDVKIGDILLYIGHSTQLIGHRLYSVSEEAGETIYICKGDSNREPDPPVPYSRVIGKLHHVRKGPFRFTMDGAFSRLWAFLIMRLRLPRRVIQWKLGK